MQKGFFSEEELTEKTQIDFNFDDGPNCIKCGLYLKCNSPKAKYTGEGRKGILIVGEAFGKSEDFEWRQLGYNEPTHFIGQAGQLLRENLEEIGLDLDRDFWKTNAVCCRPSTSSGANRKPTDVEIKLCKPLLDKTIRELKPKIIWLLGGVAVKSMFSGRFKNLTINRWRGLCIPDRKTGSWIIPLFHPSYILRNEFDTNLKCIFKRDLKWAKSCINKKPFMYKDEREDVTILTNFNDVINNLETLLKHAEKRHIAIYVDYETNALKPQWPGAKIATISYTYNHTAYAFPYQYSDFFDRKQQTKIKFLWRKILTHQQVHCIAHNLKFEDNWTRKIIGVRPRNWIFDTMLAAHIEDNRSAYCGLKFQSYIKFGLEPYNKEVNEYLRSKGKESRFNSVDKAPLKELLLYNGLDTLMGMKLYHEQQKMFTLSEKLYPKNNLASAYKLFHDGILALSDVQMNGVRIDEDYYKKESIKLERRINELRNVVLPGSEEAQKFEEIMHKKLNVVSTKDLGILLYDVLKIPKQLTLKDNYRVDADALDSMDSQFVKDLLELRKLEKAKNTYIMQFMREVCQNKIFPFYDLNIAASYRSSSQMPNFQNIPAHDPLVGKIIRSGIFPSKGNKIFEADYSSIEVKCAAIITGDPNLREYVIDPSTDMHRDVSMDIWMIPQDEVTKEIRFNSKGGWTFSQFYGSYYKNCATDLWKHIDCKTTSGITLEQNLKDKGISTFEEFVEHCKDAEDIFWGQRFKVYAQWKKDICEKFRKNGFIENPFGFRFIGNLSEKQVCNYIIQSSAFLILLKSLILINNIAKEEKWLTKLIGQIHDSVLGDTHPKEESHVIKTCNYIMSEKVKKLYPWIDVPIDIEIEMTAVDQPWWSKKEIDLQKEIS